MFHFTDELRSRNEPLFYFSAVLFVASIIFFLLAKTTSKEVAGVNAWFKPFKFAISIAIYCETMSWLCYDLPGFNLSLFSWTNMILFGFEIMYITIQAARAKESHFNQTTPFNRIMFGGMAIAAIAITIYAAYVGMKFFQTDFTNLPICYVWGIRLSIFIFIIFSFEGILMGGRQTHTVGTQAQTTFLPLIKWNMKEGDLRVAHFIGMHALQIIPLVSFYILTNIRAVFAVSGLYLLFAAFVLVQALRSKPFIKSKQNQHGIIV